jgi:hypothetical protein
MADLLERVVPLANPQGLPLPKVDPASPCGARMKGFAVLHLLEHIEQRHGAAAVDAWRATLPSALARTTDKRAVTSVGWLPVEVYFSAVRWLVDTHHGGDVREGLRVGHAMASRDINAFFRTVMGFTSPTTVLSLSGRFWKSYFDHSSLHVLASTNTSVYAEVRGWPLGDACSLHEVAGSLVAWMEASRAKDVRITRCELTAPGTLRIDAAWS